MFPRGAAPRRDGGCYRGLAALRHLEAAVIVRSSSASQPASQRGATDGGRELRPAAPPRHTALRRPASVPSRSSTTARRSLLPRPRRATPPQGQRECLLAEQCSARAGRCFLAQPRRATPPRSRERLRGRSTSAAESHRGGTRLPTAARPRQGGGVSPPRRRRRGARTLRWRSSSPPPQREPREGPRRALVSTPRLVSG